MGLKLLRKKGPGKNLFMLLEPFVVLGRYIKDDGTITTDSRLFYVDTYTPVEGNTQYTLSFKSSVVSVGLCYYSGAAASKTWVSRTQVRNARTFTFTTPANVTFMRITVNLDDTTVTLDEVMNAEIQLEEGSQATPYEPYQEYLYKGGVARRLVPAEYDCVEYIEASGTQYIDTDFTPTVNTDWEITMSLSNISLSGDWGWAAGCATWVGVHTEGLGSTLGIASTFNSFSKGTNTYDGTVGLNTKFTTSVKGGMTYFNNVPARTIIKTNASADFSIFGYGSSGRSGKLYGCKFWDNGTLVRNMIPVKKKSNNEYGMYDAATKQFFGNAGTGSFTGGEIIPTPYEYKMLNKEVSAS